MKDRNNFTVQYNCTECGLRDSSFFCNLSLQTLQSFKAIKVTNTYNKGSRLFVEGQPSEGVFVLCRGRVKLTTHSRNGKALILGIAAPGQVLGLSEAVSDFVHETTAEVIEPCQVNFAEKADFRRFLEQNADAGMSAIQQLSLQHQIAFTQICSLALSSCVADKLARLILGWSKNSISNGGPVHLKVTFSHEEIAEMIGTSRETVTRLLKDFRERDLITIKGSDFFIQDRNRLALTIDGVKRATSVH